MPLSLATHYRVDRLSIHLPVANQVKQLSGARLDFQAMVRFGLIITFCRPFGVGFELTTSSSIKFNLTPMPGRRISIDEFEKTWILLIGGWYSSVISDLVQCRYI